VLSVTLMRAPPSANRAVTKLPRANETKRNPLTSGDTESRQSLVANETLEPVEGIGNGSAVAVNTAVGLNAV
jgi:hypothetical protein